MSTTNLRFFQLTWYPVDGPEGPEYPDGPNGGQVQLLHVEAVLQRTSKQSGSVQILACWLKKSKRNTQKRKQQTTVR